MTLQHIPLQIQPWLIQCQLVQCLPPWPTPWDSASTDRTTCWSRHTFHLYAVNLQKPTSLIHRLRYQSHGDIVTSIYWFVFVHSWCNAGETEYQVISDSNNMCIYIYIVTFMKSYQCLQFCNSCLTEIILQYALREFIFINITYYICIYIYMCVCVCVCVCLPLYMVKATVISNWVLLGSTLTYYFFFWLKFFAGL